MEDPQPGAKAQYFEPPVDDARIERQWARIEAAGLPDTGGRRGIRGFGRLATGATGVTGAIGVALAAAAAFMLWPSMPQPVAHVSAPAPAPLAVVGSVVQSEVEPVVMALADGSEVELLPRTRLSLKSERKEAVELALERGVARFSVTKRPGRRFTVRAGDVRVTVVGTRFELERAGAVVDLRVTEGVVEVHVPGSDAPRRVAAGERFGWDPSARTESPEAAQQDALGAEPGPDLEEEAVRDGVRGRRAAALPTAPELFERAHLARRSGRLREAAEAYEQLVIEHARDSRAGLSAFEVGRLRMDALGDPRGAIAAFEQALRMADQGVGTGAFREDAMARIALAHDVLGQLQACRGARERYLSRYPAGVHRAALSVRCGDAEQ